jgi:hypothetical protein
MKFVLMDTMGDANDTSLCFLRESVEGLGLVEYKLGLGEPLGNEFPEDAKMLMSDKHPGMVLRSFIGNAQRYFIASGPLRSLVEKHCPAGIEYLPISIIDHRKRLASTDYCLINPLGTFDCLDEGASKLKLNSKGRALSMGELILDHRKMAEAPQLFRVARVPSKFVLGEALMNAITAEKLTNLVVQPMRLNQ